MPGHLKKESEEAKGPTEVVTFSARLSSFGALVVQRYPNALPKNTSK